MSSDFVGAFGVLDSAARLRALGAEPAWYDEQVAFGNSPIWTDRAGSVVLAGEVLLDDRDELRKALGLPEAQDGEILAELFARDGAAAGRYASGLVAAAVWDTRRRQMTLVRDHVGARTLYYSQVAGGWWFASRLRRLAAITGLPQQVSLQALRDYLVFSFVPGEQTLWAGRRELRPGTSLQLDSDRVITNWEPAEADWSPSDTIQRHATDLRAVLEDSVAQSLPNSGAVAAYLSGGVDSSLVTAIAAKRAAVNTYAIHFGPDVPNELAYSQLVAEHCGTRHQVVECTAAMVRDRLFETMSALDEPIGDPLTVPNYLLGQIASRDCDVVLNGEGGDPCFGGPKNVPMLLYELYGASEPRETAYLRSFRKCYDDLSELLTSDVKAALTTGAHAEAAVAPFFQSERMHHIVNRLMYANVRLKGSDHILTKVNNLTSANGLVGRSPLFSRRVVESSFAIPPHHKVRGSLEKVVLKEAVADLLPRAIIDRPKSGMMVPVERWMRGELRDFASDMLLSKQAHVGSYLRQDVLRRWLEFNGGAASPRQGARLWLVLSLELWLRANA